MTVTEFSLRYTCVVASLLMLFASVGHAQPGAPRPVRPASTLPAELVDIGIDQRLGDSLPLDAAFTDEAGAKVRLGTFFGTKPVVLALVYYECPMLCTQVLNGLFAALKIVPFTAGKDFEVVVVSFDPSETPALAQAKKASYVRGYAGGSAAGGFHFLTGDERSIGALTRAVGFRYRYDKEADQYIHASGITVSTPQGRLAQYFYGVEYSPRDIRLALVEASQNRVGSVVDRLMLFCYHYDASRGKYTVMALNLVRLGGLLTVLSLGAFIVFTVRREGKSA